MMSDTHLNESYYFLTKHFINLELEGGGGGAGSDPLRKFNKGVVQKSVEMA